ncbi:MAG: polymerase epsilon subunit (3'-5' exonuclease) [Candidatus Brocadiaceae bacterium]|nr:polymerase epsilon subunit (3'-5' exonuclease) [Candidatus Brocadiaceae bacterium]
MNLVAIDFETANAKHSIACALGIAMVEDGRIIKRASWLIRPRELYFNYYNTYIHGITKEDVKDKPQFNELWNEFRPFLEGKTVIAHNAGFDIGVLRQLLDESGIPYPELQYFCTRVLAKKVWPTLNSYRLNMISAHLGISLKHHDAEEDAVACAEISLRCCDEMGVSRLEDLATKFGIAKGCLYTDSRKPSNTKHGKTVII